MMEKVVRIGLIEDHKIVREGIECLLVAEQDYQVVFSTGNGQEALEYLKKTPTDLVIMDLNMPGMGTHETTIRIKSDFPKVKILILSIQDDERYVQELLSLGVDAYVLKNAGKQELIFAIKKLVAGDTYISSDLSKKLIAVKARAGKEKDGAMALSKRELEVLKYVAEGFTNKEIAEKIFASKRTVEAIRLNLLKKTCCKNTAALIKYCMANSIL